MSTDLSLVELVTNASILVQVVMAILVIASIVSWAMILRKRIEIGRARKAARNFEETFWSGSDLVSMFNQLNTLKTETVGMERIFQAGFREFARTRKSSRRADPNRLLQGADRAMRVALTREQDRLDNHLSFLATVGSTSPYVGLFGTVWGIMISFQALASVNQATIAMVAPGISEALIATAMGLFAAIPAVVAYNRFSNQVDRLTLRYDNFKEEFSTILQRQAEMAETG